MDKGLWGMGHVGSGWKTDVVYCGYRITDEVEIFRNDPPETRTFPGIIMGRQKWEGGIKCVDKNGSEE